MSARNFYCVKKGKRTGIFKTWEECKEYVTGFPGAEYKGFATREEACEYLGMDMGREDISAEDIPPKDSILAYVDGSYNDDLLRYAFGCVFILPDGSVYTEYGNGDNPQSLEQRNVTGEMLGAMYAVRFAIKNGFKALEIRYDYQGIESWVTGAWRSKNELTQKYAGSMREWSKSIDITFTKVKAHTNVKYNELADKMAKKGLMDGDGVPKIKLLKEMEPYNDGTDTFK
ncbi:MAG: ribonuclease H family protein [Lachnospiraceae bacterium]|nr:ribonuclease H family protein [Lachnospiraceae bacterium]